VAGLIKWRSITPPEFAARDVQAVREAVTDVPVFVNTGVNRDNVADMLALADGCVVGTHFKRDGNTWNEVDPARVARFMDRVNTLR
jgi:predicted TIM-barrel enzyme